jgi:phasin family protein
MLHCNITAPMEGRTTVGVHSQTQRRRSTATNQEYKTMTARKTAPAKSAMKPVEDAINTGKETVEAVVKVGKEAATKQYEQTVAVTKDQVEKASNAFFKGYDEMAALNQATMDAMIASTASFSKGFEIIAMEMAGYTRSNFETGMATAQKALTVKSIQELVELQNAYARANFDSALAESAKLTEMSVKVANETFAPVQKQLNKTVEQMLKPMAA